MPLAHLTNLEELKLDPDQINRFDARSFIKNVNPHIKLVESW